MGKRQRCIAVGFRIRGNFRNFRFKAFAALPGIGVYDLSYLYFTTGTGRAGWIYGRRTLKYDQREGTANPGSGFAETKTGSGTGTNEESNKLKAD